MRVEKLEAESAQARGQSRRNRVLLLIKGLGPGGAEHLLALAAEVRNQADFDYEAAFLLPWKTTLVDRMRRAGVPVHCLRGGRPLHLGWVIRLRRLLRTGRFDIVHVHSPYVAAFARLAARSLPPAVRPKFISTEHLPWSGHVWATRLLNTLTFPLDAAHVAVSEAVRESIPMRLRGGVETVVHGIALEKVRAEASHRAEARAKIGARNDEVVVGTVANFTAQKGYPYLLDAADQLIRAGVPVKFVAIGQGPLEEEMRSRHAALGLGERFDIMGFQKNPPRLLAGCDIFALASLYEGLPLALMEALALGLPVVATDVLGTREAVTHGIEGLLVAPGRADLLAAALEQLVRDPRQRAEMAAAAARRATEFDIRRAVRRMEELYSAVGTNRHTRLAAS